MAYRGLLLSDGENFVAGTFKLFAWVEEKLAIQLNTVIIVAKIGST